MAVAAARQWDDDLSKARSALNWPKHIELAFGGEAARALHAEDLEVDTDFCAMCGHDWCSVRISKEITEWASGKAQGFVPLKVAAKSPGMSDEARKLIAARGIKHACHSDNVADADEAKRVQRDQVAITRNGG